MMPVFSFSRLFFVLNVVGQAAAGIHPSLGLGVPLLRGGDSQPPMYENNGGTVLALAGTNYVCISADTRLSQGYSVLSRRVSRLTEISPGIWLGCGGCHSDCLAVASQLASIARSYCVEQGRAMCTESAAQALSVMLYQRRGAPYYR